MKKKFYLLRSEMYVLREQQPTFLIPFSFFLEKKNATISGLAVRESSSLFSLMKRSEKKPKLMSPLVFFFKKQIYFFLQSLAVMKLAANHKFYNASLNTCLNQKISSVEFLRTFTEIFFFFLFTQIFFISNRMG